MICPTEAFKKLCEFHRNMTPAEREEYRKKKVEELRAATRKAMKFCPNRNKILDQIVAEMPDITEE